MHDAGAERLSASEREGYLSAVPQQPVGQRGDSTTPSSEVKSPAAIFRMAESLLVPVFAHGISLREPAGPADVDFEEVE
jgi:hypothetical protein